jgi:hypothetical protein
MRQVTWVSGSFRAHVLAARLESEGIDVQLRGALDSQYALTVGALARVDVWVPEDQLEDAEYVLLSDEVDDALDAPSSWAGPRSPQFPRRWLRWCAVLVLATAGIVPVAAYLAEH